MFSNARFQTALLRIPKSNLVLREPRVSSFMATTNPIFKLLSYLIFNTYIKHIKNKEETEIKAFIYLQALSLHTLTDCSNGKKTLQGHTDKIILLKRS